MSEAEQLAANHGFLDAAVARGDTFRFSTEIGPAGSAFAWELQYLSSLQL
jgi:hypothetical protein